MERRSSLSTSSMLFSVFWETVGRASFFVRAFFFVKLHEIRIIAETASVIFQFPVMCGNGGGDLGSGLVSI